MCGIVGAIAERNVEAILIEGLRRLEYRGYDSAGLAIQDINKKIHRQRAMGKVAMLADELLKIPLKGHVGIAHTRWATHGEPATRNAHPHMCAENVALVHNGIIENYEQIRTKLEKKGTQFHSQTDTESIVHLIGEYKQQGYSLLDAVLETRKELEGAYALGVIDEKEERIIAARSGSPLVIGIGIGENFIASDVSALLPVTQEFIFLEEGDIADITRESIDIYDAEGIQVNRPVSKSKISIDAVDRGEYRHYMLKEIYEQPKAIADTLEGRIDSEHVFSNAFGHGADEIFKEIEAIYIIACGTSYHAGLVAKYHEVSEEEARAKLAHHWDYIYEPDAEEVMSGLLMRYVESLVYQGVVENIACEMAARMVAMKSATDNAGDMIDDLELVYNKARQASITQELSEIVAGAAAV